MSVRDERHQPSTIGVGPSVFTVELRCSMSNRSILRKANELLGYGMTKQQVFDTLVLEFPEAKPKKVADLVRYRPTLWSRERFRGLHLALLGLITASALLRVLPPVLLEGIRMDMPTAYLSLVPIATLLLGYSLYSWQGQVFQWVGWGNVMGALGLLKEIGRFVDGGADLGDLVMKVIAVAIGGLSLYLAHKVFAKPQEVKDPMGETALRYLFPDEGMGLS